MKIKHLKKIQAALLPVWLSFFAFFVAGCASTPISKTSSATQVKTKKLARNQNSSNNRTQLVNLLVDKLALPEYLEMAKSISKDDKQFIGCINSDDTYRKLEAALRSEIAETIAVLNDREIERYLILQNNKDSHFYKKYYVVLLDTLHLQLDGKQPSPSEQKEKFRKMLKPAEMAEYLDIYLLPNKAVKLKLFPMFGGDFALFKFLKKTAEESCDVDSPKH